MIHLVAAFIPFCQEWAVTGTHFVYATFVSTNCATAQLTEKSTMNLTLQTVINQAPRFTRLWLIVSLASLPFCSFTQPYSQNGLGIEGIDWIFGFYSTNAFKWYQFFGKIAKSTKKILIVFLVQKPPHRDRINSLTHVLYMTVSNLLRNILIPTWVDIFLSSSGCLYTSSLRMLLELLIYVDYTIRMYNPPAEHV